jgi:hypothetical protein
MLIHFVIYLSALVFLLDFLAASYMLPTTIAIQRDAVSQDRIMMYNVLLGWTIIVWLVLLIWAMFSNTFTPDDDGC